ncbi:unnamed protein product [Pieris brassicae]|uniref:Uncharacterized protein n=1 Tax=Pieris brassicae TaxID=7116 RepID=A0A9P0TAT2_PIEBR|nr:unnamed protein product [Pieris brassicae]
MLKFVIFFAALLALSAAKPLIVEYEYSDPLAYSSPVAVDYSSSYYSYPTYATTYDYNYYPYSYYVR